MIVCDRTLDPPACCQPAPLSDAEWQAYQDRARRHRENLPTRCPWLGHQDIVPSFVNFECWHCAWCRRDFVPEA